MKYIVKFTAYNNKGEVIYTRTEEWMTYYSTLIDIEMERINATVKDKVRVTVDIAYPTK